MKKFYSTMMMLAMMVAALSFTACGGDDEENSSGGGNIVGVWKCTYANYGEWEEFLVDNTKVGDILTFNADKTYTISGNNNESGRYSVSGNSLKFTSGGVTSEFYINELSSTTLSFTQKEMGIKWSFKKQEKN